MFKVGDEVWCKNDKYVTLTYGKIYKIEGIFENNFIYIKCDINTIQCYSEKRFELVKNKVIMSKYEQELEDLNSMGYR